MSTAESVLRRSRELSDPPYSVQLHFEGFEVGLRVYGQFQPANSHKELKNELEAINPLLANEEIPTTTVPIRESSESVDEYITLAKACPVATEIAELFHPSIESGICRFEYEDAQYLVEPKARRIVTAHIQDSSVSVTLRSELQQTPPIDTHIQPNTGELHQDDEYYTFTATSDEGLFSRLMGSSDEIELLFTLRDPRNCYTLDELDAESVVISSAESVQFEPCTFAVSHNELQATIETDGVETSWSWSLDDFGRLPNSVQASLDLDSLYTKIESERTVFARFQPAGNRQAEGPLLSDDRDWCLQQFE